MLWGYPLGDTCVRMLKNMCIVKIPPCSQGQLRRTYFYSDKVIGWTTFRLSLLDEVEVLMNSLYKLYLKKIVSVKSGPDWPIDEGANLTSQKAQLILGTKLKI